MEQARGNPGIGLAREVAQHLLLWEAGAVLAALPPRDGALGDRQHFRQALLGQAVPQAVLPDDSSPISRHYTLPI